MKPVITAQLKLELSNNQKQLVRQTTLAYRDALNYASQIAFEHNKMSSGVALQKKVYSQLRSFFGLPAQMSCNIPRQVGATYKSLWAKVKQNTEAIKAVVTHTKSQAQFFSGKQVKHKANQYHRTRKTLQQKGTRSAKRRLMALSGRERRFKSNVNHLISKTIVSPQTLMGLENLHQIREITNRKSKKKASKKQKKANREQSKWAFAELHGYIDYKAILSGSLAVKVPAQLTSQCCPRCGHVSIENRPNKGLIFSCVACHYELNSDLVGARNVALRTLLLRQDFESTGRISAVPDVSHEETKANYLSRFLELRWSVDTIPSFSVSKVG